MADHPDLLVAGARCNPGGAIDPYAPLRRLAEMLFGDLANDAAWRLPERSQVDRLQRATGLLLASLGEYGSELVDTLVPAPSVARRAGVSSNRPAAERPEWWHALGAPLQAILEPRLRDSQARTRLSQGHYRRGPYRRERFLTS